MDRAPKGLCEDIVAFHFRQEERAGMAAGMAPEGLSALADHDRAGMGEASLSADRLSGSYYYAAPKVVRTSPRSSTRSIPKLLETYEKLGIPLKEQEMLAGSRVAVTRCSTVFRSRPPSRTKLEEAASSSAPSPKPSRRTRNWCRSISARSCRTPTISMPPQSGRLHRRLVRLHPQGRALPDGAFDLFPHQRGKPASSSAP